MPISSNNIARFESYAKAAANGAVSFAALLGEQLYSQAVSSGQDANFPVGPFRGPSSRPGQYPFMDSGQGAANVASEHQTRTRRAAFGVRGAGGIAKQVRSAGGFQKRPPGGMHLIWLTKRKRKGPIHIVAENQARFRDAMRRGALSVKP